MNFIDPLGLCSEYVQLPLIPTIGSTQHYELNPLEYMRAVDNGVIGFANGIITLTNSALGSAWYIYQKGLPTVGKEMAEYLQGMGSDALAFAKNEWDYFLNTPFDKQLTGALNNVLGPKAAETYTTIFTGVAIGSTLNNASVGFNPAKATTVTSYINDTANVGKKFQNIVNDFFSGQKPEIITNKAGDKILMTADKKIRFDFLNSQGDVPHIHFELLKNGKWKDVFNLHRFYPKQ